MNCSRIAALTRWECSPSGTGSVRAVSPLTLGDGGQHIAFYIAEPKPGTFFLTDACETAMYADQIGIDLTKSRLEALNRTPGAELAEFQSDWSIEASGPIDDLNVALWSAVKLALALSFKSLAWRPKFAQAKFQAIVIHELEAQLGADMLIRQARVRGASGHMIDFPVGIKRRNGSVVYVQPVALDNNKINWPSVYEFHGKLYDLKAASEIDNRLAIIEAGAPSDDFGRAANFLAHAASVITLSDLPTLASTLLASR